MIDEAELERAEKEAEVTRAEIYSRALGFNYQIFEKSSAPLVSPIPEKVLPASERAPTLQVFRIIGIDRDKEFIELIIDKKA